MWGVSTQHTHNRASSSKWSGGLWGVLFVKKPDSRGDKAGPAPVCFEYRGSISPTRGQDLKAGAEVMS